MKRREFILSPALAAVRAEGAPARPHLYFDTAAALRLRARIAKESAFRDRWDKLLERAKRLLEGRLVAESVAEQGGGQHANYGRPSGQISEMGLTLGLAFHVTGEKQYAEKLREALLHYAGYKRWGGQGLAERIPPWHSELNTARFCFGYGAGYDAVHGFLSASERKKIADAMVRLGILPTLDDWILPEKRIHALDSMGHNWWSVCVAMAGVAALALVGDDERAGGWVDEVARGLAQWFGYKGTVLQNKPANFDPDGPFYESVNYFNYGLSEYLRFRLAYSNVSPNKRQPRFAALEKATEFFLHTYYPGSTDSLCVNFGDSGLRLKVPGTLQLLAETGFAHPANGWYIAKTDPSQADAFALLAQKTMSKTAPNKMPLSKMYSGIGWAMLRSSWKDDATLLAVKSGFTWNHAHADAGSFILFHNGAPLITDSGTCSYDRREYGGYYVQSRAHNVILFNGQGEPAEDIRRGVKTPGRVYSLLDGMGVKYIYADATGPMSRYFARNYRHWMWIGGAIVIFDDILAHEQGRIDWLLHYEGTAEAKGDTIRLTNGKAQAAVRFVYPTELERREEQGMADHKPDQKVPYLAYSPRVPAREQRFITVVMPYGEGGEQSLPGIEPLNAQDAIGVRLREAGEVTDVYLNQQADGRRMHVNTNNVIDGWDTDAYLLALTHSDEDPQNITRYMVSNGSYLRKDGQVLLDSLSKVDAIWRPGATMQIVLGGQEHIEPAFVAGRRPDKLIVNGKPTEFRFSARQRLIRF